MGTEDSRAAASVDSAGVQRALSELRRLSAEEDCLSCTIADALGGASAMDVGMRAMWPGARMAGPAFTVRALGGDLAAVFTAIDSAAPGDVLVIEGAGPRTALWGENTSLSAINRRLGGVVLDAPCRDLPAHERCGFPVFARGAVPASGSVTRRGAVGVPVTAGGVVVRAGDVVVADASGVVVVPAERLEEVVAGLPRRLELEREIQAALSGGGTIGALRGVGLEPQG